MRQRSMKIGFLNMNLKSEDRHGAYSTLLEGAHTQKRFAKIDDEHLTYFPLIYSHRETYIYGYLRRVTNIKSLTDINTNLAIDSIPPEHIKANSIDTLFLYDFKNHIVAYQLKRRFSPRIVRKAFAMLLESQLLANEVIDVNIVTDADEIQSLVADRSIHRLYFNVTFSNASVTEETKKFEEYLRRKNIRSYEISEKAQLGKTIAIDVEEQKLFKLATKEGFYKIRSTDENGKVEDIDSRDHPYTKKLYLDRESMEVDTVDMLAEEVGLVRQKLGIKDV